MVYVIYTEAFVTYSLFILMSIKKPAYINFFNYDICRFYFKYFEFRFFTSLRIPHQ